MNCNTLAKVLPKMLSEKELEELVSEIQRVL